MSSYRACARWQHRSPSGAGASAHVDQDTGQLELQELALSFVSLEHKADLGLRKTRKTTDDRVRETTNICYLLFSIRHLLFSIFYSLFSIPPRPWPLRLCP